MSEADSPLTVLGERLRSLSPPSLSILIAFFEDAEDYQVFISLVGEFLPEREREILTQPTPTCQMSAFASYFEDRYFPIDDNIKLGEAESYTELTRGIPVIPRGLSYDDYHYMPEDWRSGFQLITYLIESPYDGDSRIALAEACEEQAPAELLQQVPEGGLSPAELHQLLDDTPYKAVALWADVLFYNTGNFFLDTDYETLWNGGSPEWDQETVEILTRQWQQADRIEQEVSDLAAWLEEDPPARFGEILNFIMERRDSADKRAKGLSVGTARGA